jgi:hypothetical protein
LLLFTASDLRSQDEQPKFEVGVHYTTLFVNEKHDRDSGPGIRFTYNVNDNFGLEAETNALPQTREGGGNNEVQVSLAPAPESANNATVCLLKRVPDSLLFIC